MTIESETPAIEKIKVTHKTLTGATVDTLRSAIQQGRFVPGSQLPPELELIERLGISRTTLREALRTLEEQGFITRKRGLGTYVCEQPILKDMGMNFGVTEMIQQAGRIPGTQNIQVRKDRASNSICTALQVLENTTVIIVERVRTANQRPVVWSLDYMPATIFGDIFIEASELQNQSLYGYLETRLNIRVTHGVAQLRSIPANSEMAVKLSVRAGSSLMLVEQTDFDTGDKPVLHSIEHYLPDSVVFQINRRGPAW